VGALTRAEIVTQGLREAGNTSLTTRGNEWLNRWLRSQYMALDWPFLQRRATGISLALGATSVSFGAGSSVTPQVQRIHDPVWLYNTDYTVRRKARIVSLLDGDEDRDETINNPSTHKGVPTTFKARPDATTEGKWTLVPEVIPDRSLLIALDYTELPDNINTATAGDSTKPRYPNDDTMIQAVYVAALKHDKADNYMAERDVLASMVLADRVKFGAALGINDTWGLDPKVFGGG
jgi:hypothetical protein